MIEPKEEKGKKSLFYESLSDLHLHLCHAEVSSCTQPDTTVSFMERKVRAKAK